MVFKMMFWQLLLVDLYVCISQNAGVFINILFQLRYFGFAQYECNGNSADITLVKSLELFFYPNDHKKGSPLIMSDSDNGHLSFFASLYCSYMSVRSLSEAEIS